MGKKVDHPELNCVTAEEWDYLKSQEQTCQRCFTKPCLFISIHTQTAMAIASFID